MKKSIIICIAFLLVTNHISYSNTACDCGLNGDYNKDGRIDLKEAIYALQVISSLKNNVNSNQVIFGQLANTNINIYLPTVPNNSIYTGVVNKTGSFDVNIDNLDDDEYVVVAISEGTFLDNNNDLVPYSGVVHSLIQVSDLNLGKSKVSIFSDIVYQYVKNIIKDVDSSGIKIRLDDIARVLFKSDMDLNDDGILDAGDIIDFDPLNDEHKKMLSFDYQNLLNAEPDGYSSVLNCYYKNKQNDLLDILEDQFGTQLSLFPDKTFRDTTVKINVVPFGRGKVTSLPSGIMVDSETEEENVYYDFFEISDSEKITLTAIPIDTTKIIGWDNCDFISEDKTQCVCNLDKDHEVRVTFGYKETIVKSNYVDVSRAIVNREGNMLTVTVHYGDTALIEQMDSLTQDNYVVGSAAGGFLLKILNIKKISSRIFLLTTSEDASLEDLVEQGTGSFSRLMTHGDLVPETKRKKFQRIKGVRLLSSDDHNDTQFTIQLGSKSSTRDSEYWKDSVILYDKHGVQLKIAGEINMKIKVNTHVSFGLLAGLEGFKFETVVQAHEQLDLIVIGELKGNWKQHITSIPFGNLKFFIGPVPVYLIFNLDISVGVDAELTSSLSTSINFEQHIAAGVNYNKDYGFQPIKVFNKSCHFNPPDLNVEASIFAYLRPDVKVLLYGVTGPKVSSEPGLKVISKPLKPDEVINNCKGGIDFTSWFSMQSHFAWNFSGNSKIGKLLYLDELEEMATFPIYEKEIPISNWNVGGVCGLKPAELKLTGSNINHTQTQGSEEVITRQFIIQNTGNFELNWTIEYFHEPYITFSQTNGKLDENESVNVVMTIDTSNLPIGIFNRVVKFKNISSQSLFVPDILTGSTYRMVNIIVAPPKLQAPVITSTILHSPTIVRLNWEYPHDDSNQYVEGYYVFKSKNQENWQVAGFVSLSSQTSMLISNLEQETNYYFNMTAYDQTMLQSDVSNIVSIKTASISTNQYTITPIKSTGVSIYPDSPVTIQHGSNQTFIITPNEGYEIAEVIVDGRNVGKVTEYTFENITSDHTISVVFSKIKCPIWKPSPHFIKNMALYGNAITYSGQKMPNNFYIGAFGPGGFSDVRGSATISDYETINYYMLVYSENKDVIKFKACDNNTGAIYEFNETIIFEADAVVNQNLNIH